MVHQFFEFTSGSGFEVLSYPTTIKQGYLAMASLVLIHLEEVSDALISIAGLFGCFRRLECALVYVSRLAV